MNIQSTPAPELRLMIAKAMIDQDGIDLLLRHTLWAPEVFIDFPLLHVSSSWRHSMLIAIAKNKKISVDIAPGVITVAWVKITRSQMSTLSETTAGALLYHAINLDINILVRGNRQGAGQHETVSECLRVINQLSQNSTLKRRISIEVTRLPDVLVPTSDFEHAVKCYLQLFSGLRADLDIRTFEDSRMTPANFLASDMFKQWARDLERAVFLNSSNTQITADQREFCEAAESRILTNSYNIRQHEPINYWIVAFFARRA
ncbi:uncharacterized protein J3D65DRAFT_622886 [Phyllosticta citribraziliensis]|uniref:Uncharacterized protein n=1 Tax=Phyllosticta citribraziliensis TaxID=989973 RepID=A0ABR1LU56_9PEZI